MAVTRDLWVVLRARDEASRIVRSFGQNVAGAANLAAANVSQFDRAMQNVGVRLDQFARTAMLTGAVFAGFGAAGLHFIKSAIDVAAEYDKQSRRTLTQIDDMAISLEHVAQVGRKVAREVPIPFEQMQDTLFFIFSSIDTTLEGAEVLLRGFAKEAVAGQSTIEAAAKSSIAIINSLGLSVNDLTRIQDVQFQTVRKGIITYEELASVIGRVTPAAARSGQSIETVGAMLAFLTRNGLSAAMASASAARALESFAHPKTVANLAAIGISVKDAKGEFLPLLTVIDKMNQKLGKMTGPERAGFLQELFKGAGGTIQARRFWDTVFKNFDQFEEMVGHMKNSSGVFEDAYATMAGSVAAKTELIKNKWLLIKEALGRAVMPHFLKLLGLVEKVVDWFDKLPEPTKAAIAQFLLWGSVISVVVGIFIILVGTLAFFVASVMMAGTALVAILGIIAALVAGTLGLIAAFTMAWRSSENFRAVINELKRDFTDVWNQIVITAKKVYETFNKSLRPSLNDLWETVDTKVIPVIKEFIQMLREEVVPKIIEARDVIVDLADKAFKYTSDVINNEIIPAMREFSAWWDRNSKSIKPILGLLGEVVKWLIIATVVILAMPFIALVTSIGVAIVSFFTMVGALKFLWKWIVIIGTAIGSFFVDLWNDISNIVSSTVSFLDTTIKAGLSFIYNNTWVPFWNMFGGLIKEVWGLITDLINIQTTLIKEIIKDWLAPIKDFVVKIWTQVWEFLVRIWNNITSTVDTSTNNITTFIKRMADIVRDVWNGLWESYISKLIEHWKNIINIIKDRIEAFKSFFIDARTWLIDAGKNVIQGFIDGITDKIRDLREKLKEINDLIPKVKGPKFVDLKLLMPAGQNIMKGLTKGIKDQIPMLRRQLQGVTATMNDIQAPSFNVPESFLRPRATQERVFNQNITVHTQEIDPRIHATELGWLLEGRVG